MGNDVAEAQVKTLAEKLLDVETSELPTQWALGKSRHCVTGETVCNTLVETLADNPLDVEAKTIFDTLVSLYPSGGRGRDICQHTKRCRGKDTIQHSC